MAAWKKPWASESRMSKPLQRSIFFSGKSTPEADLLNNEEALKMGSLRFQLTKEGKERKVGYWLLGCAGAVVGMIILGGYTRLTKSGLSMTKWKPIGYRLPQTTEEWESEFEHYRVQYSDVAIPGVSTGGRKARPAPVPVHIQGGVLPSTIWQFPRVRLPSTDDLLLDQRVFEEAPQEEAARTACHRRVPGAHRMVDGQEWTACQAFVPQRTKGLSL